MCAAQCIIMFQHNWCFLLQQNSARQCRVFVHLSLLWTLVHVLVEYMPIFLCKLINLLLVKIQWKTVECVWGWGWVRKGVGGRAGSRANVRCTLYSLVLTDLVKKNKNLRAINQLGCFWFHRQRTNRMAQNRLILDDWGPIGNQDF